jgi:hemerythrin-like domain-containing protein
MKKGKSRGISKLKPKTQQSFAEFLKDPIEFLMQEHKRALHSAAQLRDAVALIQSEGFSFEIYLKIAEAIRFIDKDVRHHNEREEKYLFPLLARHAPKLPQVLCYEHREFWSAFGQLARIVNDVADGSINGSSIVDLVQSCKIVAKLLAAHIEEENTDLFPLTKQLLTCEEYEQLTEGIAHAVNLE